MRKALAMILALMMLLALAACGSATAQTNTDTQKPAPQEGTPVAEEPTPATEETTEEATNTVNVTFDYNYDGAPESLVIEVEAGSVIQPFDGETVNTAPETPTREGYRFAGWDTEKEPTLENGYSTTAWPIGDYFLSYYAMFGDMSEAKDEHVRPQTDVTLFARWVEKTMISDADELFGMREDLAGWYELAEDIDLTGYTWCPVGTYRSNYEWMNQPWWLEAFRGKFDGAGHVIKGLTLDTTEFYDVAQNPDNALRNGCAGFFGAAADGAEICNVTLTNVSVQITGMTSYNYIAPLIAFVEGCNITDCHVIDLDYRVTVLDNDTGNGMYTSLGGLVSGIWAGEISECSVQGSMVVELISNNYHIGDNFIGGLVGDGYTSINNNTADVSITIKYKNNCIDSYENPGEIPTGMELIYATGWQKILAGGLAGQINAAIDCVSSGDVSIIVESEIDNTALIADPLCGVILTPGEEGMQGSSATGTLNIWQ